MANRADRPDDESATQPFWPFPHDDDDPAPDDGPDPDPDATRIQRPIDATQQVRPTARIVDDGERERWSARAGVPAPGDPAVRRPAPPEWAEEEELEEDPYHGRSWFTPVIVGVVALVLVGALSVGLYLIYRSTAEGRNAPADIESSSPAAVSSAPPTSAAPPSSAPPSSEAPPSEGPEPVVIPPLRGNTLAEATVKLQGLGLNVKVERVEDDSVPPGEVLSARPGEGQPVLPGETVTLLVATPVTAEPSVPRPSASASR